MLHGMSGKIRGGQGVTQGAALKRVLVIKHGALGDMVQGFDAFAGLRAGLPDTHLALLTTPPFLDLAGRMPWVDEVLCDRRAPVVNLAELWRMRGIFRAGWDAVIDLQCSRRTAQYHRRSHLRARAGSAQPPEPAIPIPIFWGEQCRPDAHRHRDGGRGQACNRWSRLA